MLLISKLMIFAFIFGASPEPATMEGGDATRSGESASAPLVSLTMQEWALPLDAPLLGAPSAGANMLVASLTNGELLAVERATGAPVWSVAGRFEGTPAVDGSNGRVWATAKRRVVCLDLYTGEVIWEQKSPSQKHWAPALVDGTLYIAGEDGQVLALRDSDGAILWQVRSGISHTTRPAPVVADERLFVASVRGEVVALSLLDGKRLWKTGKLGKIAGCIAGGSQLYCLSGRNKLVALDQESGNVAWRVSLSGAVAEIPVVSEGSVFVAGKGFVSAYDAASGEQLWKSPTYSRAQLSRPVIAGEFLYTGSVEGTLFALLAQGGHPRWRYQVGGKNVGDVLLYEGQVYGSAGKMLFAMQ